MNALEVCCTTPMIMAPFDPDRMLQLFTDHPRLASSLAWLAAREDQILAERLVSMGRRSAYERLAHIFLELWERLRIRGLAGNGRLTVRSSYSTLNQAGGECVVLGSSAATAVILHGGTCARTGRRSRLDIPSIVAISSARAAFYDESVPRLTNEALFLRDRHLCCYCGQLFAGRNALLTRDHVMPMSRGGSDIWDNCVTSCRACNQKKDNRLVEETALEMLYIPYTPSRAEAMILENRRILADQMDYLLAQVPRRDRERRAAYG